MKSALVTCLFFLGVVGSAAAQRSDRHAELPGTGEPAENRVTSLTRDMSGKLQLNEGQYIKLRNINRIKLAQADEIQWQYRDNSSLRQAKMAELEAQYESECSRILTPTQLSLLRNEQPQDEQPKSDSGENGVG
ncbi:hypothetical protein [Hymenobacter sp. BT491]|uniref:hypothetical protein n=1 Tax=Hymenobacter sp. BT491 TaxID=2766779 RepID=UPI001653DC7E|nr:hypothetical protein [Hymenobacter sp. BT491]MBC6990037.1 hypothetical protein [Hymenobacter sp. BT491]